MPPSHHQHSIMLPLRRMQSARLHQLLFLSLWVATVSSFRGGLHRLALKSIRPSKASLSRHEHSSCIGWVVPRGGSTEEEEESDESDSEEETDTDTDQDEATSDAENECTAEESDNEDDDNPLSSVISSEPLTINVKTNLGNKVVDQTMELLVSRTRDVASVKQTLSRQLPGRPPESTLTLMSGSRVLGDEELVDELVDDEDEEDDEEEGQLVLTLDMVPPVDPKFATMLDLDEMTTSEILDAYTANAAAMYNNAQSLVSEPSSDKAFGSLSIQLRHEAYRIRDQLTSAFPESALNKLDEVSPPHETQEVAQRRGQRYRSGRGGAKTNMKRTIQRNLNVNWADTIRNFMLFIFFGLFGGRNSVSRNLLLLGAPLCFVLQARPVKIMLKQAFYAMANPPGIFLSLLPAPQQAILSFNENDAREELYGVDKVNVEEEASEEENFGSGDEDDYDNDAEYDSGDESDY